MIVSWSPVVWMDMIGSSLSLLLGFWCTRSAWLWRRQKPDDIFRDYIFLLTLAFAFFVISRSFSHLVKQILLLNGLPAVWADIAPFSGATTTASFIVIFAFGVYFQRFQRVHLELEAYKNNLEELVAERTCELKDANRSLEKENRQRRQAEEGLRQASATLENVFMSASPLCITAVDYELVEANMAYLEIWPNPRQDHESVKCYESRPGNLCHTAECPLEQVIHGREEVTCEAAKLARDGSERVFLQTTRPFRDADGNLIGTVTSFQDITARKQAMKELAAERERLSVTLRSIGDGVITTDLQGRVLMLNKVAEKLCGWSQQEAMGRPLVEVFRISNEKTGKSCENPVDQVLATGNAKRLANHTVLLARDGRSYCIADSAAPIRDAESMIIGVVLVFRDVTEKKRMEEELLKTEKLKSVGLLAGGIAHDFNNILAAILGNIDLAIHRLGSDRVAVPLLAEAEKASLRAKDLTQQLLTFAKGGSPVLRTVSIAGIIRDSALFILRGSNVDCKMDIPDDLWLVDIDPGQMSQVIQNMTLNARQVMPDGGTVVITCRNHRERSARSHRLRNWVEITIADQGPGVDPGVVDRIFDPYFSTKQGGCGLGLSICHSIITQHKGRIKVSSAPAGGAVFIIQLPASTSVVTSEQQVKLKAQSPRQEGGRILVMDDDVLVANIAREILATLGYEPVVVKDGLEAIRAYKQAMDDGEKFDAVIMDLTIPGGMGGKKAVGEVLALDPTAKVIVSSGYSNDPVMAFFQEHGFCAAIAKPFLVDELKAVIGRVLNS